MNSTLKLLEAGQSVWYDNIQRSLLLKAIDERRQVIISS